MPKRSEKRDTAKAEYIAKKKKGEEVSLRALAGELGVSYQTMRNWKAADKWEEALPKKKRGGQPGNQNSKGKRNAAGSHDGAPPGNKNAEKDGAYSTVFFDMLSAEELKITESVPLGGREALEHEMKILKFREHKILAKIAEYESQPEDALFVSSLLDMRTPGGRGKDKKDGANQTMDYVCSLMYKSVIIGKTCAMIPKIITGNKYGKAVTNPGKNGIADNLLTLTNLEQVYARNYFVPTNTLGVELLSRTVTLTRDDLNQMIEMWLSEMTNTHTCVDAREYTEAYIDDDSEKTLIFPIIELEELVYQKAGREKYHIVCERGTQDGISRTMGNKVIDFKDMNNEPMPAHKYDDAGIRRDGINPLTHSGYWEEEP